MQAGHADTDLRGPADREHIGREQSVLGDLEIVGAEQIDLDRFQVAVEHTGLARFGRVVAERGKRVREDIPRGQTALADHADVRVRGVRLDLVDVLFRGRADEVAESDQVFLVQDERRGSVDTLVAAELERDVAERGLGDVVKGVGRVDRGLRVVLRALR